MIIRALQMIGEKTIGGTLTTAEQTAYLSALNAMLDSWSIEGLMVPNLLQESKALTTSVGSYTIGSGGSFNTTRPTKIVDPCFIRDSSSYDHPLVLVDAVTYGHIGLKTLDGSYPQFLYYDMADVAGLGTIYLYPEPSASLTLYINSWKQLQQFATISDAVVLPAGYQRAIESNMAVELAPGFTSVLPEVRRIAAESKAAIKKINTRVGVMQMPAGIIRSHPNIITGWE
jgi:hypothetical protein